MRLKNKINRPKELLLKSVNQNGPKLIKIDALKVQKPKWTKFEIKVTKTRFKSFFSFL